MKRIGAIGLVVVLMLFLLPLGTAAAAEYGTVKGGWLRLRTAPSYDATVIGKYYTGTKVEILGTRGNWYNVRTPDNKAGFMHADYITTDGSGGSGGSAITKYVTSSNGYGVRLRSGPGKSYRVIGVYDVGTKVSVLLSGSLWSQIKIGTTAGYMMSEFLTSTNPGTTPPPSTSDMATVRSDNGYSVRLRSGPGTAYSIIGLYSVGTRVSVQSRGSVWDRIIVGSREGYMMNEFLRYDNATNPVATAINMTASKTTGMQGETINLNVSVTGYQPFLPRIYAGRYRQRRHGGYPKRRSAYQKHGDHRRGDYCNRHHC